MPADAIPRAPTPEPAGNAAPRPPRGLLALLVLAQFCGTSLWFAPNAVMADWQRAYGLPATAAGTLSAAVQLGFIAGTLVFAALALADRHPPRRVFVACGLAGAALNAATLLVPPGPQALGLLVLLRALTGLMLAGIYPVGMKIVALWFPRGVGPALGSLVGALVLGTAAPHLLRALGADWPWAGVLLGVSALAAGGALLVALAVPEPPRPAQPAGPAGAQRSLWRVLREEPRLRASVLGYTGHMWELYTLWVLAPLLLAPRLQGAALSAAAFGLIAAGALGCVGGGWLVGRAADRGRRSAQVATALLACSGLCCLLAPWAVQAPDAWFALWLAVWGISVAGDSPQFSALNATHAPPAQIGQVLTAVNGLGFAVSMLSIELFSRLAADHALAQLLPALALGPLLGVLAMRGLLRAPPARPQPDGGLSPGG